MRRNLFRGVFVLLTAVSLTSCATEEGVITDPALIQTSLTLWFANLLLFLPRIIAAMVLFVIALYMAGLISRIVQRVLEKRRVDPGVTLFAFYVTRLGIAIFGAIWALKQVNFDVTAFLAGLGILGFTLGFALQDISQNLIAGFLLLIQKPFEMSDLIQIDDYTGHVKSIDLRATELVTLDGHNVLIPNAKVFTTPITNYSRQALWRIKLPIGVAYDSDLEKVQRVTLQAIQSLPDVLEDPAPTLFFHTFNDFSIDCTLQYWIDGRIINPFAATHPIIIVIQKAYQREGIEIPYPIQTEIQTYPSKPQT